jgi:hypothetical protein
LGITANKKPTATIRKPAVVFKSSRPAISDTKPLKPAPRIKGIPPRPVFPRRVAPAPLKPEPPKPPSPEIPLGPEQHLEEMLQLVHAWLDERGNYYQHKENVLDKARKSLAASRPDFYTRGLPESPMSAAQLRDYTRPPEMDEVGPKNRFRGEHVCALWLARWLGAWEPKDEKLRKQVLDQTRARVTA